MWIDILFGICLAAGFYKGFKNGLLHSIFFLIAFFIGILIALKLSYHFSLLLQNIFGDGFKLAPALSMIILFVLVMIGIRMVGKMAEKIIQAAMLGWFNRLAGAVVWCFIFLFLLSTAIWYLHQYGVVSDKSIARSRTYSIVEPISPEMIRLTGKVFPFMKDLYEKTGKAIDKIPAQKPPAGSP